MRSAVQSDAGSSPHARGARRVVGELVRVHGIIPACAGSTYRHRRGPRLQRDHPRMRGEHVDGERYPIRTGGSSPHARGALGNASRAGSEFGIIPACAGSTGKRERRMGRGRDHPRMRGEHLPLQNKSSYSSGSSPHARGALLQLPLVELNPGIIPACAGSTRGDGVARRHGVGIIPACAGSTLAPSSYRFNYRDHPRMRGEHTCELHHFGAGVGSSPHARGAHLDGVNLGLRFGIIPACAGSTLAHLRQRRAQGDHPRMRGEHMVRVDVQGSYVGSSPHARGARRKASPCARRSGIIPACAGSTLTWPRASTTLGDHPRMRGEHAWIRLCSSTRVGSSPHARGAQRGAGARGADHGIIPACAGSTYRAGQSIRCSGDHPRMRGEHVVGVQKPFLLEGSSPHARGALVPVDVVHLRLGIIPACAGSTRWHMRA